MSDFIADAGIKVKLLDAAGTDSDIVQAARVSTQGENELTDTNEVLLRYLMKNRHGSPFEHGFLKFYVKAPIFVFREFHRHRIGFSYNEVSGRYKTLEGHFYTPPPDRPLCQTGKPGHYNITNEGPEQERRWDRKEASDRRAFEVCWKEYQYQLAEGIPNEMARTVLPVALMSEMYVSCNPRSLMHFLSLRTHDPEATFVSKPLWEIDTFVARSMEAYFTQLFPVTAELFHRHGRVAP